MNFRKTAILAVVMALAGVLAGCSKKPATPVANPADDLVVKAIGLASAGQLSESLEVFQQAIKLDPEHPRAWCGMGTVRREMGSFDEAIEYYTKAISIKPDYAVCMDNLGIAYMRTGKYLEAKEQFDKAIETDPTYADAKFNLGVLYEIYIKDIPASIDAFRAFIEMSSDEAKKAEVKSHLEELEKGTRPR